MDAQKVEDAILEEITALSIPTLLFPEKPDGYFPRTSPGEVLVRYVGCKYSNRDTSGVLSQKSITVELIYVSRLLRGDNGLYEWLDKITHRLEGYTPLSLSGHFEITDESFTDYTDGTWYYTQNLIFITSHQYEQIDHYSNSPIARA